jgi:transcriptional regulator with XRE-family HTH domain
MTSNTIYASDWRIPLGAPSGGQIRFRESLENSLETVLSLTKIMVPKVSPNPAPSIQIKTRELIRWTGWSQRELAEVLGTTHPTIGALTSGRTTDLVRRSDLKQALMDLHAVCMRLRVLFPGDKAALRECLQFSVGGESVAKMAASGRPAAAYIAALEACAGRHAEDLPQPIFPLVAGEATAALHD